MLLLSQLLGRRGRNSRLKNIPYECGMIPTSPVRGRLSVRFYLVAMLFILFDIEVVFLYPWAASFRDLLARPELRHTVFLAMLSFLGTLFIGYLYALKKGAFDWKR
ncbi:MAG: NADH-quinone oxidoreductase subunit A [Verrucomicrobia bacterium]|nr:MAG: NADH-quinone oxidoreductase subunit A [Verrucomicrobiota bacterium]